MSRLRGFAVWLLNAVLRHAPEHCQQWASAMLRELDFIEGDWAALFYFTDQEQTRAYDSALAKSEADARIFEEYIGRTIRSADDTLLLLRELHRKETHFDLAAWTQALDNDGVTPVERAAIEKKIVNARGRVPGK